MNKKLFIIISLILAAGVIFLWLNLKGSQKPLEAAKVKINSLSGLLNQVKELETQGKLLETKMIYQRLINEFSHSRDIPLWQKKVEDYNIRLLFSSVITPNSILYEIKPGDTLAKIAKEFKTTVELIMKSNNLSAEKIVPGKKIKVWTLPFSIVVDKSQNTLFLKAGEEVIKTYTVSTGANNTTPAGNFKIVDKIPNPPWFKPGAGMIPPGSSGNILGSRWLGLNKQGYGIHGTTDPQSLGKQITQGCVRMSNSDVEELYIIVPQDTEVTIID